MELIRNKKVLTAAVIAATLSAANNSAFGDGLAKSVGELSGDWWQWAEEYGGDDFFGEGWVDCSIGQRGNIWFLAGSQGVTLERECLDAIPAGKQLFFPLVNFAYFTGEGEEPITVLEKRELLDGILSDQEPGVVNSEACGLFVTVDGEKAIYAGTAIQRVQSPTFEFSGDPEGISDGYWALLPPLSGGEHTIRFGGRLCDFGTGDLSEAFPIDVDVTYVLEVRGKRK